MLLNNGIADETQLPPRHVIYCPFGAKHHMSPDLWAAFEKGQKQIAQLIWELGR